MVELVAIINSFNRLSLLQKGLPALISALEELPQEAAILIFDAGSTDGSREWLEDLDKNCTRLNVKIISPIGDSSFSAGINEASRQAERLYPDLKWLFFYETDNWIKNSSPIKSAINLLSMKEQLSAVGFTVKNHDGKAVGFGCPFPTLAQFLIGPALTYHLHLDRPSLVQAGSVDNHPWYYLDVVFTSPILMRYSSFKTCGLMDEKLFPFSDCDADLAWRLNKLGLKMAVLQTDDVVHDNSMQLSNWSATRSLHFHRGRMRLLVKHLGHWVTLSRPLLFLRHCLELLFLCFAVVFLRYKTGSISTRLVLLKSVWNDYQF